MMNLLLISILFLSQASANTLTSSDQRRVNDYVSAADQEVDVKKVVILPFNDNANGIYSKKMEEIIKEQVETDHQYQIAPYLGSANQTYSPDYLAEATAEVSKLESVHQADSVIAGRITQGPKGIQAKLALFHRSQLLVQSEISNFKMDSMRSLEEEFKKLYKNLKAQLPYQGVILSRTGNNITVNFGSYHGLKQNDAASVIQLLKINRHPKHRFLVGTEREVLGKIRFTKVEEFLSFGTITFEKETLLLRPGHKVATDSFVQYSDPGRYSGNPNDPAFGEDPKEWAPPSPPQYGRVQLLAGISQYNQSTTLQSAGNLTGTNNAVPNIIAFGEMWLNKNFFIQGETQQAIFSMENPQKNSTPTQLNMSYSKYNLFAVYNLPLSADFFGPRVQFSGGIHRFHSRSDESTPITFTNMEYGGMAFGLAGAFPVHPKVDLGLQFKLFLTASVTESSALNSGSSGKPSINNFSLFGNYKLQNNINIAGRFDLEYYSSDFDRAGARPDPASNISHKMLGLYGGIEYLF